MIDPVTLVMIAVPVVAIGLSVASVWLSRRSAKRLHAPQGEASQQSMRARG